MLTDTRTWPEASEEVSPDSLLAARSGDARAFRNLFDALAPMAWRLALVVTGETTGAADAVATGVGRSLGTTSASSAQIPDATVAMLRATWLAALDVLHRDRRRNDGPSNAAAEASEPPVTAETNLEAALVSFAFLTLPEQWRGALWLTEAEGLSTAVAGAVLDLVPEAFAQLLDQARAGFVECGPRVDDSGSSRPARVGDVGSLLRPALGNLPPDLDATSAERWQAALVARSGWQRIIRSGTDRLSGEVAAVKRATERLSGEVAAVSQPTEPPVSQPTEPPVKRASEQAADEVAPVDDLARREPPVISEVVRDTTDPLTRLQEILAAEAAKEALGQPASSIDQQRSKSPEDGASPGLPVAAASPMRPVRRELPPRPAPPTAPAPAPSRPTSGRIVLPPRPAPPTAPAPAPSRPTSGRIVLPPRPAPPTAPGQRATPALDPTVLRPTRSARMLKPTPSANPGETARSEPTATTSLAPATATALFGATQDDDDLEWFRAEDDDDTGRGTPAAFLPLTHIAVPLTVRRSVIGVSAGLLCAGIAAAVVISQVGSGGGHQVAATAPASTSPAPQTPALIPPSAPATAKAHATAKASSHSKSTAKSATQHHVVAAPAPPPTYTAPTPPPTYAAVTPTPARTTARVSSSSGTATPKPTATHKPSVPAKAKVTPTTAAPTTATTAPPTTTTTTVPAGTTIVAGGCTGLALGSLCL